MTLSLHQCKNAIGNHDNKYASSIPDLPKSFLVKKYYTNSDDEYYQFYNYDDYKSNGYYYVLQFSTDITFIKLQQLVTLLRANNDTNNINNEQQAN